MPTELEDEQPLAPSKAMGAQSPSTRYRLVEEHGRGGLGRVWKAYDTQLDRIVALKQSLHQDPRALERFEREAKVSAKLQHPSIVPVYDAGLASDGTPWFVMKLVSGETLKSATDRAGSLEARLRLVPHVERVAEAMAYAHREGVLHRDLKPDNVLVGDFGEVYVIDWGIARAVGAPADGTQMSPIASALVSPRGEAFTRAGAVLGTPNYMAPEQASGGLVDERTDVFAMGAMLHEVVTGRPLTDARALEESGAPGELMAVIRRAVDPAPGQRYQTMQVFREELESWLAGRRVSAYGYGVGELVARWLRKHRAAVTVSVLALMTIAVVGVYAVRRVIEERDVANRRAVELTLVEARTAVTRDPTATLAWLLTLPPGESAEVQRALGLEALARGVSKHVLGPHESAVNGLLFASENDLVSLGDRKLRHWDLVSGREVSVSAVPDEVRVFAASADGRQVAFSGSGDISLGAQVLKGHAQLVKGLAFAADGSLVSAAADGTVRRWRNGVGEVLLGGRAPMMSIAACGSLVIAGERNGSIHVLGGAEPRVLEGHRDAVESLLCEGDRVVSASDDGQVRVWDLASGESRVVSLTPAPTGLPIVAAGFGRVAVVTPDNSVTVVAPTAPHPDPLPQGRERESALRDGLSAMMDAGVSGREKEPALRDETLRLVGHTGKIVAVALGERLAATSSFDGSLRVWDLRTGRVVQTFLGHTAAPRFLAISPSGKWLASAGHDRVVRVWPLSAGDRTVLVGHEGSASGVNFAREDLIVSTSIDRSVRVWPLDGGAPDVFRGHNGNVYALSVDAPHERFVTSGADGVIKLWPLATPTGTTYLDAGVSLGQHASRVTAVTLAFDGGVLLASGDDGLGRWKVDPPLGGGITPRPGGPVVPLKISSLGTIGDATLDGTLELWLPGANEPKSFKAHSDLPQALAFSPDGMRVLTGGWDGALKEWNVADGTLLRSWSLPGARVRRVAYVGDDSMIAVTNAGDVVRLPALQKLPLHRDTVRTLEVSRDRTLLITGGFEGLVGVWDTATGRLLDVRLSSTPVEGLSLAPSSRAVAVATYDGTISIWPVRGDVMPGSLHESLRGATTAVIFDGTLRSP
ncbi:MAG: serine/threonine protein kinase [Archangium sp.]|nr:serine/threonine protein kinase [Archangium sp.]